MLWVMKCLPVPLLEREDKVVMSVRTQKSYRFSLQFSAKSEDHIKVGEFLENLGNKKSAVIIAAMIDYLACHPELNAPNAKVQIKVNGAMDRRDIEKLIRSIIDERLSEVPNLASDDNSRVASRETLEADITSMLGNLSIFG